MTPDPALSSGERKAAIVDPPSVAGDVASISLMLLRLATRWFAIDVHAVAEVALKGAVTRVPTAPHHIMGITTLRGRLVTVVCIDKMLGGDGSLARDQPATLPRLVVVRHGEYEMALVAESIHGIRKHAPPAVPSDEVPKVLPEFVCDEFDWQAERVALLDIPKLIAAAARLSGIDQTSELVEA